MNSNLRFSLVVSVIGLAMLGIFLLGTPNALAQGPTTRAPLANAGTAFTYQGQLKNGGAPVNGSCDIAFGLYDAASAGNLIGTPITPTVTVANGLFTTLIDFSWNTIPGDARWLDVQVRCPSGNGSFIAMTTRQALTPAPMALALPGLYTQQNNVSPNIIGGYSGNLISPAVVGGTIGGGGSYGFTNGVMANYATVSGGNGNIAAGQGAVVGGGGSDGNILSGNQAWGSNSTIGGGTGNTASGLDSTVSGGMGNTAFGIHSTVGGGNGNLASGLNSTVPGGAYNTAGGEASFAAGTNAKVSHKGAFVWADSTGIDFASTGANQFLIRANGGVGINTNAPVRALDVNGVIGVFDGGTRTYNGGLASEVNGQLVEIGINDDAVNRFGGAYNSAAQGGLIRVDTRAGQNLFQFYGRGAGSTTLYPLATINNAGVLWLNGLGTGNPANPLCLDSLHQIATCTSSVRYKNNITNLNLGLDTIAQLRPVTFVWKSNGQPDLGFIAEEVNQVIPLLTILNQDGQIEGVKYDRITAILVKGMQEQQQQITDLKTQNVSLEARVKALEKKSVDNANGVNVTFDLNGLVLGALMIGAVMMYRTRRGE